jgi:hypothetical protein
MTHCEPLLCICAIRRFNETEPEIIFGVAFNTIGAVVEFAPAQKL